MTVDTLTLGAFFVVYFGTTGALVWALWAVMNREQIRRDQLRAEHHEERKLLAVEHEHNIERVHAMYDRSTIAATTMAERMMNIAQFGTPTRPVAEVIENEPDAVTRAGRAVDADTVRTAAARLGEEYARIGIQLTDDELLEEARGLLAEGRFVASGSLRAMIDASGG